MDIRHTQAAFHVGPGWAPVGPDWGPFGNAALLDHKQPLHVVTGAVLKPNVKA